MTLLLDTHVLLWLWGAPHELSTTVRDALENPQTRLWASAASAWEISMKTRLGKLPGGQQLIAGWHTYLDRARIEPLPITDEHALLAGSLDWHHRDPFDRVLAAQAMLAAVPLVSRDRAFSDLPGLQLLW